MRTDRIFGCMACGARTAAAPACGACGTRAVINMSDRDGQVSVVHASFWRRDIERREAESWFTDYPRGLFVALVVASVAAGAIVSKYIGPLEGVLVFLCLIFPPAVAAVPLSWRAPAKARRLAAPKAHSPRLDARARRALPPAHVKLTVRGRVHARQTVDAPVSGTPCAAFRVVGHCGTFEIDDAWGLELEVVSGDDEVARVRLDHAMIDIPTPSPQSCPATPYLQMFLAWRGIAMSPDLAVGEGVLVDGDEVTVEGLAEDAAGDAEGYRGLRFVKTFHGTPDSPVVVRKAK